jgi:hypothetical protein
MVELLYTISNYMVLEMNEQTPISLVDLLVE